MADKEILEDVLEEDSIIKTICEKIKEDLKKSSFLLDFLINKHYNNNVLFKINMAK